MVTYTVMAKKLYATNSHIRKLFGPVNVWRKHVHVDVVISLYEDVFMIEVLTGPKEISKL